MNIQIQQIDNPYIPDQPATHDLEFLDRENVINGIRNSLGGMSAENPLVICGPSGTGKTSLLYQLASGALDEPVGVLYADFRTIETSPVSAFLWQLSKAIMAGMEQQNLEGPTIEKRMLVLNPRLVFRQRFWNPLLAKARSTPLMFAWDNFDALTGPVQGNHDLFSLRAYLYDLLKTDAPIDLLLSITGRVEAVGMNALSPFQLERSIRLTNLDREQTVRLIRRSDEMVVYKPVADFIFGLTSGHPGDTHRLCHALFERQLSRGHQQVTIADVIGVLQEDLSPSRFLGAVYQRLNSKAAGGA